MNPLVSVITPCYNGDQFLEDYFQSLLAQSYENFEVIFVNDGSTDQTEKIALTYQEQFKQQGINFKYFYQANAGQAAAMNAGFPYMQGKYLVWPDADDVLAPESIKKRVLFLEEHPEYGLVRSSGDFVDGITKQRKGSVNYPDYNPAETKDIFLDLINEKTFCTSGCYMVRTSIFREIYPDLKIYESSAGQNWQILIPAAGRFMCGYIDEELYHVTVHGDSHSRQKRGIKEKVERLQNLKRILEIGIEKANRHDKDYNHIIEVKYHHLFFRLYFSGDNRKETEYYYKLLKQENELSEGERRAYLKKWYPIRFFLYRVKKHISRS